MTYIDPVEVSPKHYKVLLEDERVRVLEMLLKPGEMDNTHSHPFETVYFVKGGRLRIALPDGSADEVELPDGAVMSHGPWTHQVANVGDSDVHGIIIEAKQDGQTPPDVETSIRKATTQKGNIQFLVLFSVPAEHVAEGDRIFQSHARWIERTHHRNGDKALLRYNVSKAPEMKNPMDPNSGLTGRTNFILGEVYAKPDGLADHWQQAEESWEDFDPLKSWLGKTDFSMVNGAEIVHSLW